MFSLLRHRLLVEAGRLSLLLRFTDLTKVILDALANVRLKVRQNSSFLEEEKPHYFSIQGTGIFIRSAPDSSRIHDQKFRGSRTIVQQKFRGCT